MKIIQLPKGRGKFRKIYMPDRDMKRSLKGLVSEIADRAVKASDSIHGFAKGRSPVTCAMQHVGRKFTVTMDLTDFFESVNESHLRGKLSKEILSQVLVDGAPRQGLPTSPAVANLAAADMDKAILKYIDKLGREVVYTRYADDLTFSCDEEELVSSLLCNIPAIVSRCGFRINKEKTHVYNAKAGRRMIVGVAVDDSIHVPRYIKRKMRAAKHQENQNSYRGLEEWSKLKLPRKSRPIETELKRLAELWRLGSLHISKLPERKPDEHMGQIIITGDPVMIMGMSNFTTGWRSCMTHPDGGSRRGVKFWMHLKGTYIAYSARSTKIIGGVERPAMNTRCLIHTLENGVRVYDRIYGHDGDYFRDIFQSNGILCMYEARKLYPGAKVVGAAPATWRAYFDNLRPIKTIAESGPWKGRQVFVCRI